MSSRLEQYLEEVSKPIAVHERREWRTEAEQHLNALTAAYEELGYSPEEATELALSRFGEAQTVGKQVCAEMRPALFSPATVVFLVPLILCFFVMYLSAHSFMQTGDEHILAMMLTIGSAFNWISAITCGWWAGRLLRDTPFTRRSLLFFLPLTLWTGAGVCIVGTAFLATLNDPQHTLHGGHIFRSFLAWFPLAAITATLTYASRRSRKHHAQPT